MSSTILRRKLEIDFDPENPEHVQAALMPITEGTMHPELRFKLKLPFLSVPDMALTLCALKHVTTITGDESYEQKYLNGLGGGMFSKPASKFSSRTLGLQRSSSPVFHVTKATGGRGFGGLGLS